MDEFSIIEKYFAPLSKDYPGAFNLKDDAATYTAPKGKDLVFTKDAIIQGVHFLGNEKPEHIAHKLLAVNVSDLAAMGATPKAYLLALMLPQNTDEKWISDFSKGLADSTKKFGGHIIGGDTSSHNGDLVLSLTAIGEVPTGQAIRKSGAKPGDKIYVSGTIGDSYLGLQILTNKLDFESQYLKNCYYLPNPKIKLAPELLDIASSCTDISDGLGADLKHICDASDVGAVINIDNIPLSDDAKKSKVSIEKLLTGGDDFELIFTIPADKEPPSGCYYIGDITKNKKIIFLDSNFQPIKASTEGYKHFEQN